ncbi:ABI gene family member 3 isoform X2 [Myotis myotis]|uniref:ABI gene family member 3 isoform X2 n=1 Tax=Myotis myotis TaxID=51298 RepID=UPI0017496C13|nr:ABI gene family member 3 isoform X2 [Myotis myotis]
MHRSNYTSAWPVQQPRVQCGGAFLSSWQRGVPTLSVLYVSPQNIPREINSLICPSEGRADPATTLSHLRVLPLCSQASPLSARQPQGCGFLFSSGSCSANNNPHSLPPGSCSKGAPSSQGNSFQMLCVLGDKGPPHFPTRTPKSLASSSLKGKGAVEPPLAVTSNPVTQMVNMHMEKVARREIGTLATVQRLHPSQKVIAPKSLPPLTPYFRKPLNFGCLDDIGHGIKDLSTQLSRTGTLSRKSIKAPATPTSATLGRAPRIPEPVQLPVVPDGKLSAASSASSLASAGSAEGVGGASTTKGQAAPPPPPLPSSMAPPPPPASDIDLLPPPLEELSLPPPGKGLRPLLLAPLWGPCLTPSTPPQPSWV